MMSVKQVLDSKGYAFWSVSSGASALEAAGLMAEKGVGALLVMEDEQLLGLISERDFARKLIISGKSPEGVAVGEIMSTHVVYVRPNQGMDECMALMTDKRIRHLPVLDEERVIGIVSIGDAVKSIIEDQQFIIEQLENYITT